MSRPAPTNSTPETLFCPSVLSFLLYYFKSMLTLTLTVCRSTTHISIQFELSLLRWLEYPPDANHGFYVAAASVTARLPDNRNVTSLAPEDSSLSYAIWGNPPSVNTVVTIYTEVDTLVLLSCGSDKLIFSRRCW